MGNDSSLIRGVHSGRNGKKLACNRHLQQGTHECLFRKREVNLAFGLVSCFRLSPAHDTCRFRDSLSCFIFCSDFHTAFMKDAAWYNFFSLEGTSNVRYPHLNRYCGTTSRALLGSLNLLAHNNELHYYAQPSDCGSLARLCPTSLSQLSDTCLALVRTTRGDLLFDQIPTWKCSFLTCLPFSCLSLPWQTQEPMLPRANSAGNNIRIALAHVPYPATLLVNIHAELAH